MRVRCCSFARDDTVTDIHTAFVVEHVPLRYTEVGDAALRGSTLYAAFIEITTRDQRPDLTIGDAALEHPETTVRMNIPDAARANDCLPALDQPRDCIGAFDLG